MTKAKIDKEVYEVAINLKNSGFKCHKTLDNACNEIIKSYTNNTAIDEKHIVVINKLIKSK